MGKIAVHCPTEDEWKKVTKKARGDGWEFTFAPPYYTWNRHKENTCLDFDNKEDKRLDATSLRYYKANNYTIISASDYLSCETRECLDRPAYGLEGKPTDPLVAKMAKIMREPHSIPLRVDDKVRVVKDIVYSQLEGQVGIINDLMGKHPYITGVRIGNENFAINTEGLELIPTEADITVGSVWEGKDGCAWGKGEIFTVTGFDHSDDPIGQGNLASRYKHDLLENYKLIHRGDGEMWHPIEKNEEVWVSTENNIQPKTNKKEKKMKRAGKVIQEGMLIVDRDCSNHGKVITIHEGHDKVTYEDIDGSDVHTVRISRLYIPLEMPKPKPVKKKTKKTTKKGK